MRIPRLMAQYLVHWTEISDILERWPSEDEISLKLVYCVEVEIELAWQRL